MEIKKPCSYKTSFIATEFRERENVSGHSKWPDTFS